MDVQVNAAPLIRAIADEEISQFAEQLAGEFRKRLVAVIEDFVKADPTAERTHELENLLHDRLREFGRSTLSWLFGQLEVDVEKMPRKISYRGRWYRRLRDKTKRSGVLTRFGKIDLIRARYRLGRRGITLSPLELVLGIEDGCTPAAAVRIGKQFAAAGSSQGRTREMIADQMGAAIGNEKLRKLTATLAEGMEPFRERAQVEQLHEWIVEARESGKKPVLAVSRDAVALGLAPWSIFEMASVACISVMADGKKLGTVYLGRTPESNQATLSKQLTDLLTATVRRCGATPDVVYVSDAGKVETAYWKKTLRKFFVDGKRIKITRIVDYYHASERLTKIADALKFGRDKEKRQEWLEHVRWLLLQPGGHGRVLRSIARMRRLYGYRSSAASDAAKAERYLRRYRQFMDYATAKSRGCPIGSGVVESACKQIVTERMKLSGMRWSKQGGQKTMTLRCILLSGVWDAVYKSYLRAKPTVSDLIHGSTA